MQYAPHIHTPGSLGSPASGGRVLVDLLLKLFNPPSPPFQVMGGIPRTIFFVLKWDCQWYAMASLIAASSARKVRTP